MPEAYKPLNVAEVSGVRSRLFIVSTKEGPAIRVVKLGRAEPFCTWCQSADCDHADAVYDLLVKDKEKCPQ